MAELGLLPYLYNSHLSTSFHVLWTGLSGEQLSVHRQPPFATFLKFSMQLKVEMSGSLLYSSTASDTGIAHIQTALRYTPWCVGFLCCCLNFPKHGSSKRVTRNPEKMITCTPEIFDIQNLDMTLRVGNTEGLLGH